MISKIKNFFNILFQRDFYTKDYEEKESYSERLRLDPVFFITEKMRSINLTDNQKFIIDSLLNKNKVFVTSFNYSHVTHIQKLLIIWFLLYNPNIKILVIFPNDNLLKDFMSEMKILLKMINIDCYPDFSINEKNNLNINKLNLNILNNSKLFLKTTKQKLSTIVSESDIDIVFMNQCMRSVYFDDIYECIKRANDVIYFNILETKHDSNINQESVDKITKDKFLQINLTNDTKFTSL